MATRKTTAPTALDRLMEVYAARRADLAYADQLGSVHQPNLVRVEVFNQLRPLLEELHQALADAA